jgi:hypothetical protein
MRHLRRSVVLVTLVGGAVVGTACSDDAGEGGLSEAALAFIDDLCAVAAPCCRQEAPAGGTCATQIRTFAQGTTFDAARVKPCLDSIRAEARDARFCERPADTITCAAVFKKAGQPAGQPCRTSADCANGPDSDGLCVGSGDQARCRLLRRGAKGEACVGTRGNGKTDELVAPPATATALCFLADGIYCDAATKTCVARGTPGANCTFAIGACVDAAYCPRQRNQCTPRKARGELCADSDECTTGNQCANDGSGEARCRPFAKAGESCPRGDECDPGANLTCDGDTSKCAGDTGFAERACAGGAIRGL